MNAEIPFLISVLFISAIAWSNIIPGSFTAVGSVSDLPRYLISKTVRYSFVWGLFWSAAAGIGILVWRFDWPRFFLLYAGALVCYAWLWGLRFTPIRFAIPVLLTLPFVYLTWAYYRRQTSHNSM